MQLPAAVTHNCLCIGTQEEEKGRIKSRREKCRREGAGQEEDVHRQQACSLLQDAVCGKQLVVSMD